MVDALVYEAVGVSEELAGPPIVAEDNARVERQLRFADGDGLLGRATKARVSVAERRRAKVAAGAEPRQVAPGNAERMKGARVAYETFHNLPWGTSTIALIERS